MATREQQSAKLSGRIPTSRFAVFVLLAAVGCGIDLWTKHLMFHWSALGRGAVYWVWQDHAGFQTSLNEGALFGLGQGGQFWFALISVAAAVAIPVWLFVYGAACDWWMTAALGGILGGVLGNLYDRLGLPGLVWQLPNRMGEPVYAVRDWILLQWSDQARWPNFNIADALLVVGAAVLFLRAWNASPQSRAKTPAQSE